MFISASHQEEDVDVTPKEDKLTRYRQVEVCTSPQTRAAKT
jgi:hypothetical protein